MSGNKKKAPLSGDKLNKAIAHLKKYWKPEKSNCPVCECKDWMVDGVFEFREFGEGQLDLSGRVFPFIVIACKNCGYSFNINAIKAEVVEPEL